MSIFNTNAARADECFSVGVKCRNQPVADGKPVVIFFYLFCLHLKIRITTIRLVFRKWVVGKPRAIFDTGGRTHASAALWHIESVNKARHVFVAPDMDVLNKKVRSKGEQK